MQPFYEYENDKKTRYKKAVDLPTIIRQVFMKNYKAMILMFLENFSHSDKNSAVIGYSSGNFVGSILST